MAEGGGSTGEWREREEELGSGRLMERFFMFRSERGLCGCGCRTGEEGGEGDGEEESGTRTIREDGRGGTTRRAVGGSRLEDMRWSIMIRIDWI